MNKTEAIKKIKSGKFFTVKFRKRSTGEIRKLHGRVGVKKYLKGGSMPYSAKDQGLIPVFEKKVGYKNIPVEGILELNGIKVS